MPGKKLFKCQQCGLHYEDEKISKQCAAFCKQYNGCSLEITKLSVERNSPDTNTDTQPRVVTDLD